MSSATTAHPAHATAPLRTTAKPAVGGSTDAVLSVEGLTVKVAPTHR